MIRKAVFLILVGVIFMLSLQCGKKQEIAGKVGDRVVTAEAFKKALFDQFHKENLKDISLEDKQKTLNTLLDYQAKLLRAYELNLQNDPDLKLDLEARENNLIAQKLYEILIVDKLLPEEEIRLFFNLRQREIKGNAVVIGYEGAEPARADRSKEEALARGQEVLAKLSQGENIEDLAAEYSDAPDFVNRKGLLNPYNPGMFSIEVDRQIVDAKANDVIGPVLTERGVVIIKVSENNPRAGVTDYETMKPQLKKQIYQRFYKRTGNDMFLEITKKLKEELGWEVNRDAINKFIAIMEKWKDNPEPLDEQFTEEERSLPLAYIGDMKFSSGYFIDQFRGNFVKYATRYQNEEQINKALISQIDYFAWILTARKKGLQDDPDIRKEMQDLMEHKMIGVLDKVEIRDKIEITPEDLQKYYEANKAKYIDPRKIRLWQIGVKDKGLAQKIYKIAKRKNANFQALAKKYSELRGTKNRGGDMGFQTERSSLGSLITKAIEAGPGKIIGPEQKGLYYYILKTGEFKPARQKTLDEVRTLVEGGVRREKSKQKRAEMMEGLKEKYPYWINKSLLKEMS